MIAVKLLLVCYIKLKREMEMVEPQCTIQGPVLRNVCVAVSFSYVTIYTVYKHRFCFLHSLIPLPRDFAVLFNYSVPFLMR